MEGVRLRHCWMTCRRQNGSSPSRKMQIIMYTISSLLIRSRLSCYLRTQISSEWTAHIEPTSTSFHCCTYSAAPTYRPSSLQVSASSTMRRKKTIIGQSQTSSPKQEHQNHVCYQRSG